MHYCGSAGKAGGSMTDKQLLEAAAKAAGITVGDYHPDFGVWNDNTGREWNPLTNDGDAFRLAVLLGIEPRQTNDMSSALWSTDAPPGFAVRNEMHNGDPLAATRRSIVRAAAAIGSATE